MHVKEINTKNRVYNYYFDNLVKAKEWENKNILIDGKNYKNLVIYFTRYAHIKSIKILIPHYPKVMERLKNKKEKIFHS